LSCLFAYDLKILASNSATKLGKRITNRRALLFINQLSSLGESLFGGSHNRLGFVASFDELSLANIFFGVLERIKQHLFNLLIGQTIRRLYFDRLLEPGSKIARGDGQNAVRVDQELHFYSRKPGRLRRYALQSEPRKAPTIVDHLTLAL